MHPLLALLVTVATAATEIHPIELRSMVEEIAPVVEQVAGRPFLRLPPVVATDEAQLEAVIFKEQVHLSMTQGLPAEAAEHHARVVAHEVADSFAGKYGFLDKVLYVSVEGIAHRLAAQRAPAWLLRPMVRVVLAHELAHALQDQHTDLAAMATRARGEDAVLAINCAVEGHAVWVHEAVAARMGLSDALDVMTELLGTDRALDPLLNPSAYHNTYVYGLGRDFVAFHVHHGGTEQVWKVLERPPATTQQIATPARWASRRSLSWPSTELRRAVRRLAPRKWMTDTRRMGDYEIRDQLLRAEASEVLADALVDGWNARAIGAANQGLEVQHLRFESAETATSFVVQMRIGANRQVELLDGDPFVRATSGQLDCGEGWTTAREGITVALFGDLGEDESSPQDKRNDQLGRLWVSDREHVLQVIFVNARVSDARLCRVLRPLVHSLGSARNSSSRHGESTAGPLEFWQIDPQ
ncbi:MAG: hypothetical protein AAGA48_08070 [Myxococcota bacterium]